MKIIDLARIKTSCRSCNLVELCLPRGLGQAELEQLEQAVRRSRPLQKGETLFRAGDALTALYAVRSGSIKLHTSDGDAGDQILGFYLPGEILGLDGIERNCHACTAVALETSSACAISYGELTAICKRVPGLQDQMLRIMGREISLDNQLLLTINKRSAEGRIATFLLSLSSRFHQLGYSAAEFKLSMSRQDIGEYLGLTIETVSRIFTRLQKQGLISTDRRIVKIEDMQGLKALCVAEGDARPAKGSVA